MYITGPRTAKPKPLFGRTSKRHGRNVYNNTYWPYFLTRHSYYHTYYKEPVEQYIRRRVMRGNDQRTKTTIGGARERGAFTYEYMEGLQRRSGTRVEINYVCYECVLLRQV